jgi:hypothetical protein
MWGNGSLNPGELTDEGPIYRRADPREAGFERLDQRAQDRTQSHSLTGYMIEPQVTPHRS